MGKQICKVENCASFVRGRGYCNKHYLRYMRYGSPHIRKKNANGEGGISSQGYHTITINGKRVLYHRYVMEQWLCRKLLPTEIVHHLDGNKLNNLINNLALNTRSSHVNNHPESLANLKLGPQKRRGTTH